MEAYMPAIELIFIDGIRNKLEFIKGANKKKKEKKNMEREYEEQSKIRVNWSSSCVSVPRGV